MVALNNIFKDKEDKEKLTSPIVDDPEKADLEAFEIYITPTVLEPRRYSKTRFCVRLLFLLTCLLFGIFLIIGGVLLYRHFTTSRMPSWYRDCSVRYRSPQKGYLIDNGGLYADKMINKPIFKPKEVDNDESDDTSDDLTETGELKQDISLNLTAQVEEITVPDSSIYKKATFMHDFLKNWSLIYDFDTNKCFIFALDRNKISPPKDLFDMILKTMSRYYLPENVLLHQKMVVDKKLDDLTDYGENIAKTCKNADSYLLKKRHLIGENHNIDKRNTIEKRCEHASNFIESGGKFTLAYHLEC